MQEEKICPVCGESFKVPPTRPKQKYCSMPCSVIGRRTTKEETAKQRVDEFIDSLLDIKIVDVLEGRFDPGNTDNRIYVNAKGASTWPGKKFIVLVIEDL